MLIAYLTGLFFIIPFIAKIIKQSVGKLENKNCYTLLGGLALGIYVYLCSFLVFYIHNFVNFVR